MKTDFVGRRTDLISSAKQISFEQREDFTAKAPHPVFDPSLRLCRLRKELEDPQVGVVLLDFITGPGVAADPITAFAQECAKHPEIVFISTICGSFEDPQNVVEKEKLLKDAIAQTREMERICVKKNYNYPIPNMDFDFLPVGIDIRKVLSTGISPVIHGGMFNKEGGLIGAGMARIPMECFEKAMAAFVKKYGA